MGNVSAFEASIMSMRASVQNLQSFSYGDRAWYVDPGVDREYGSLQITPFISSGGDSVIFVHGSNDPDDYAEDETILLLDVYGPKSQVNISLLRAFVSAYVPDGNTTLVGYSLGGTYAHAAADLARQVVTFNPIHDPYIGTLGGLFLPSQENTRDYISYAYTVSTLANSGWHAGQTVFVMDGEGHEMESIAAALARLEPQATRDEALLLAGVDPIDCSPAWQNDRELMKQFQPSGAALTATATLVTPPIVSPLPTLAVVLLAARKAGAIRTPA